MDRHDNYNDLLTSQGACSIQCTAYMVNFFKPSHKDIIQTVKNSVMDNIILGFDEQLPPLDFYRDSVKINNLTLPYN